MEMGESIIINIKTIRTGGKKKRKEKRSQDKPIMPYRQPYFIVE